MLEKTTNFLCLPSEVSQFEENYLRRINRVAMGFFLLHLPVFVLIAWLNGTGVVSALLLTMAILVGPIYSMAMLSSSRRISVVMGVTAMLMGGVLVHIGQGPVQIEMHFYFFVLIALLAVFANPMVIVAAALTAAAHHAILWAVLPASVFNYDAPFWVVAVHATFVILESIAACFIARSFFNNVIELEKKVAERTRELELSNRDLKLVLDSVEQGFMIVGPDGQVNSERSQAVDNLIGPFQQGDGFFQVLTRHDRKFSEWMELGFEEVFTGILPTELTIHQLPKRLSAKGKTLEFSFTEINVEESVAALAVVVSDITAEVIRERLEEETREFMTIADGFCRDPETFLSFHDEGTRIIESLKHPQNSSLEEIKRKLHTLKGNSSIQGLTRIASLSHQLEDFIQEHEEMPEPASWQPLLEAWDSVDEKTKRFSPENSRDAIEVSRSEYSELFEKLLMRSSDTDLALQMANWSLEPTDVSLKRVVLQTRRLAQRLGRDNIEVKIRHHNLCLDAATWSEFWSAFIHIVRNAIDHGLEPRDERKTAGKPETACLEICSLIAGNSFVITVRDDGRGIDWDRIMEVAYQKGIPAETHDDRVAAVFADGISTASEITETSGRGVGMAAVRQATFDLGGRVSVESEPGEGTTFRFTFPIQSMAPKLIQRLTEENIDHPERAVEMQTPPPTRFELVEH